MTYKTSSCLSPNIVAHAFQRQLQEGSKEDDSNNKEDDIDEDELD